MGFSWSHYDENTQSLKANLNKILKSSFLSYAILLRGCLKRQNCYPAAYFPQGVKRSAMSIASPK